VWLLPYHAGLAGPYLKSLRTFNFDLSERRGASFRFVKEIITVMTHVNSPTICGEARIPFGGAKATVSATTNKAQLRSIFIPN